MRLSGRAWARLTGIEYRSTIAIASRDSDREIQALLDAFRKKHPAVGAVMGFTAELPTVERDVNTVVAGGLVDATFAFEASGWHTAFARALEIFGEAFEASSLPIDLPIVSVLVEAAELVD